MPVALFILDMQFLWVYADDLIGKGLSPLVIAELMMYASARLVNLALPLGILVASIMALGSLAEKNEVNGVEVSRHVADSHFATPYCHHAYYLHGGLLVFKCRLARCQFKISRVALFSDQETPRTEFTGRRFLQRD